MRVFAYKHIVGFKCPKCGRLYKWKGSLRHHLTYVCQKEPTFQCYICSHACFRKGDLKSHLRHRHNMSQHDCNL
ncbi:hypothetical protein HUJ04_008518 [Dendroctonus ponderosae]|nr:hypothetical protein HUJ04_008518 [Dendroctonus ponderosae]